MSLSDAAISSTERIVPTRTSICSSTESGIVDLMGTGFILLLSSLLARLGQMLLKREGKQIVCMSVITCYIRRLTLGFRLSNEYSTGKDMLYLPGMYKTQYTPDEAQAHLKLNDESTHHQARKD